MKISMTNALYSNSNYDGKENGPLRQKLIDDLEEQFKKATELLYNSKSIQKEDEDHKSNPFFKAVERGLDKQGVPKLEDTLDEEPEGSGGDWKPIEEFDDFESDQT